MARYDGCGGGVGDGGCGGGGGGDGDDNDNNNGDGPCQRSGSHFSQRRPGFSPRSVHVEFVVDTVTLGKV